MNKTELALFHFNNAITAHDCGNIAKAIINATMALEEATEWPLRGHIIHALASLSVKAQDHNSARHYWVKFFQEFDGNSFPIMKLATSNHDAAVTYRLLGDYSSAIYHYYQALPTFRSEGRFVVRCIQNLAFALCAGSPGTESIIKAEELLSESKLLVESDEDIWHQLVGDAFLCATSGKHSEAITICNSLLSSSADNATKAQACFVAGKASVDMRDKANAKMFVVKMAEFAATSERQHDLSFDLDRLQKSVDILD